MFRLPCTVFAEFEVENAMFFKISVKGNLF